MLLELKFKDKEDILIGFVMVISFICILYSYKCSGVEILDKYDDNVYEEYYNDIDRLNITQINKEYLPVKAHNNISSYLVNRPEDKPLVLDGDVEITDFKKDGLKINVKLNKAEKDSIIEFPFLYYYGYEARCLKDGSEEKLELIESENGFVATKIEDTDITEITVEYKTPVVYKIAYIISSISFVIGIIIVLKKCKKNDKSVETVKIQ